MGKLKRESHVGDTDEDGRIILKWIFEKHSVKLWTILNWLRAQSNGGLL